MNVFTDSAGRKWTLNLTIKEAKRIKAETKVDVLQPEKLIEDEDEFVAAALVKDQMLSVDVVSIMIEEQAKALGMDKKEIENIFDAKTVQAAQSALEEETINFYLASGKIARADFLKRMKALVNSMIETTSLKLDSASMTTLLEDETEEETSERGNLSIESQDTSESTPAT